MGVYVIPAPERGKLPHLYEKYGLLPAVLEQPPEQAELRDLGT